MNKLMKQYIAEVAKSDKKVTMVKAMRNLILPITDSDEKVQIDKGEVLEFVGIFTDLAKFITEDDIACEFDYTFSTLMENFESV